jgi:hypothetical protein
MHYPTSMPTTTEYQAIVVEPSRSQEHHSARLDPRVSAQKREADLRDGASMWISEFRAASCATQNDPMTDQIRRSARRGDRPAMRQSTGATELLSAFGHDFGKHDPHNLGPEKAAHPLAAGTTKATGHIPGYQGFLPAAERNHKPSTESRLVNKVDITDVVKVRPVGYAGHYPTSARLAMSDFDCSGLTTMGKDYAPPRSR